MPRILLVDDELNLAEALVRGLRRAFTIVSASGGQAALEILRREPPFDVIVSDLRMPGMDGINFLRHARQLAPSTVRVLFTGHADLDDAIEAVNEGAIFRFVMKPCPFPAFKNVLDASVEQRRLITAERVLLEQTLQGSVKALTDVLALANPAAFGRGTRVLQRIKEIMPRCGVEERWPVEVAAMLSQIGCVALSTEVLEKLYHGQPVTKDEQAKIDRAAAVTEELLSNIPRLDPVRQILVYHNKEYNGEGPPRDGVRGESIPWGARALKVALDLDALESQGVSAAASIDVLRSRAGSYDPAILNAVSEARGGEPSGMEMVEVSLRDVRPGMIFAEDVRTARGLLLIARGQEVTLGLMERVSNFSPGLGIKEPIRMMVQTSAACPA
ncbi:MAG TPA: HD domain-containing phosphohydrolase [Terriglobia bacterium]|nr:HD domain-containing phosphohydrolase [Terriglobia bacterium]